MPPASDRPQSVQTTPLSGRRIISRIASPFANKSRNIVEFSIEPDDPHKQHSPGEIVTGCVKLRVARPTRVTHIVVCLHGFVQVFKNPGSPGEGFRANGGYLGTGRGRKGGEYFGNGFASLFEDEVVLCGDGRLAEGLYQFNYELEFPDRDLPSSIDFERGTITYMITATVTRPTTISPIITCDRKIYFMERIDISPLYPPKSRTITLEPLSRRTRAKNQARKLVDAPDKKGPSKSNSAQPSSDLPRNSETSSAQSTRGESQTPVSPIRSDAQSDISYDSRLSSHERMSQPESQQRESPTESDASKLNASKTSLGNKVITATIESQAGGCLRGDSIPVKVNVNHTKHVKSLYGVIVTLYRQARVDMRPAIPLGPTEKGKDAKFEDYYPKSMTGLGGLSLSGAGSTHVFRKDLSQAMAPLLIDPLSLTAEINTRVRVPDEIFPTISTVPGGMISFRYYVEVIVDIQGKLAGQHQNLGNYGGNAVHSDSNIESILETDRSAFTPFGSTMIDTAPIRRDKGVVTSTFEVIVGTGDSERKRGKRKMEVAAEPETQHSEHHDEPPEHDGTGWYGNHGDYDPRWYDQHHNYYHPYHDQYYWSEYDQSYDQPPPSIPIPQLPDESEMTEKQRIQQAETRLLPSQPPGVGGEGGDAVAGATAPHLPYENGEGPAPSVLHAVPESNHGAFSSNGGFAAVHPESASAEEQSVPEYTRTPARPDVEGPSVAGDDKQELQRHLLQANASAPPADDENDAGPSSATDTHVPSAPALTEMELSNDVHDSHADAAGSSGLPRYER